jgi:hypothetical protein
MADHLDTVADYFEAVRVLLQDTMAPQRYSDQDILVGFNTMLLEARRLRADLFVTRWGSRVPHFEQNDAEEVRIDPQFRLGLVYGTAAYVLTFDQEDVNDARANTFMNYFHSVLTGISPPQVQGGTPGPKNPQQ